MTKELGNNYNKHYCTGDEHSPNCPACYTSVNSQLMGIISIDGKEQEVHKCNTCNILYSGSGNRGAVDALITEARGLAEDAESVEYKTVAARSEHSNGTSLNQYDIQSAVRDANNDPVSGNLAIVNSLATLNSNIGELIRVIGDMNAENKEMMEKLVRDPLLAVRQRISDFSLD